jgi:hypothetical protein
VTVPPTVSTLMLSPLTAWAAKKAIDCFLTTAPARLKRPWYAWTCRPTA